MEGPTYPPPAWWVEPQPMWSTTSVPVQQDKPIKFVEYHKNGTIKRIEYFEPKL